MDADDGEALEDWAAASEEAILDRALPLVSRLGWSSRLVRAAARDGGLSEAEASLLLPGGSRDLAALLAERHDRRTLVTLGEFDPFDLKVRERIRTAVAARLEAAMIDETAVRRWMGFLVLPANAALGARLLWASADALWRWAGDTATDENHYSKRTILSEILASTLALRLAVGAAAAERHLDRRIGQVMAFEKWKAGRDPGALVRRLAERLGRWRYRGAAASVQPARRNPATLL